MPHGLALKEFPFEYKDGLFCEARQARAVESSLRAEQEALIGKKNGSG
jgi:hypothetical protein